MKLVNNWRRGWRGNTGSDCGLFSRWIQEINPKNLGNQVICDWHMQKKKHRKMNRKHCVCYGSASYGVNAALDQGHFEHPKEDEGLLSHWQLGSRHWWLKWPLLQGSCQPLTLAAYRQLDAPGNHTESHQLVMTHVRLYVKNILCQTGHFGLNSIELFSFRSLGLTAFRHHSPMDSPVLLRRDHVCFCWLLKNLCLKVGAFVCVC